MPRGPGTVQGRRAATTGAATIGDACAPWIIFYVTHLKNRFFVRVKTLTQKSGTRVAFPREIHMRPSSPYLVIARGLVAIIVLGGGGWG